jgi:hypothetical protein
VREDAREDAVPAGLVAADLGVGDVAAYQRRAVGKEGEEDGQGLRSLDAETEGAG